MTCISIKTCILTDLKSDTAAVKKRQHQTKSDSPWEKSKTDNLYRYKPSGVYFVRARVGGKLIRKSLETKVYSVAVLSMAEQLKEHRKLAELHTKAEEAKVTIPHLEISNRSDFLKFVDAIENAGVCSCYQAADLVRFLAFGGFRKKEAAHIVWGDIRWRKPPVLL